MGDAFKAVLPEVNRFFCAKHRKENVGRNASKLAPPVFSRLVQCRTVADLASQRAQADGTLAWEKLTDRDRQYISGVEDKMQFPAAAAAAGVYTQVCLFVIACTR